MEGNAPPRLHIEAVTRPEWDPFAAGQGGSLFFRSAWGEVCRAGLAGRPIYLALKDESGTIRAGMPGLIVRKFGLRVYHSMYPYGGPIGEAALLGEAVRQAERALGEMGVHSVRINLPPGRPVTIPGHRAISLPHHAVDLGGGGGMEGYRPHARRDVRRARRAGVTVERLFGEGGVREFYRLYLRSMERNDAPAKIPLRLFRSIEGRLGPKGQATFLAAKVRRRPVSAVCIVYSGEEAHALSQGSDPRFHGHHPTDLLIHSCLEDAADRGIALFDLMASPAGDESLMRFKEKWGARRGEAVTLDRNLDPILGGAVDLARRLSRVPALARIQRAMQGGVR